MPDTLNFTVVGYIILNLLWNFPLSIRDQWKPEPTITLALLLGPDDSQYHQGILKYLNPCLLSKNLHFQRTPWVSPSWCSLNWQVLLWKMPKKPDQMLGDSPFPPRDRFMVWVKPLRTHWFFSLVSFWVSASAIQSEITQSLAVWVFPPTWGGVHVTRKLRTEARGRR